MKLRVVELLLISTIPAMILAEKGVPSLGLIVATLVGGTLAAGSANAFNMVLESDLDKLMARTSARPLVTGALGKTHATIFATVIGALSLTIFWVYTEPLATLLTAIAIGFYVIVYTIAFFFVIFFWTPPHFWALAIKYKDDYEAAKIPMLPVIAARNIVLRNMWFHTIAMIVSSVALIYLTELQWWAAVITIALGLVFALQLVQLKENSENYNAVALKIFHWSITYLTLFSALLVIAQLLKA